MALIVEDGTGLSTAESYISVADATLYFTNYGANDDWTNASEAEQEVALRNATRSLDSYYGSSYQGSLLETDQALLMPRSSYTDAHGRTVEGIPIGVKQATVELAVQLLAGNDPLNAAAGDAGNLKQKTVKADGVESTKVFFSPGNGKQFMSKISNLMAPYLGTANLGPWVSVVRG